MITPSVRSPESIATASETALQVISNAPHGRDDPPRRAQGCTYCKRQNHAIRDCRVLQKHLRTGTRKPIDDSNNFPSKQPRTQRTDDRPRSTHRNDGGVKAPDIYDRFGNPISFQDLQRKVNSRGREAGLIAYAKISVPDIGLSAITPGTNDPAWTVDSVTSSSVLPDGVTPYELWHGKKPSLQYIKVFGRAAFALTPEPHRNKLEGRAKLCMFVGLPQNKKGYRHLSTIENRIIYSRDVTFKEYTFPTLIFFERSTPNPLSTSLPVQKELLPPLSALLKRNQASLVATDADVCTKKTRRGGALAAYSKSLLLNEPIDLEEEHTQHYTIVSLLATRYDPDSKTYKEAMRSAYASDWHAAALSEYNSLIENKTWTLVPRLHNRKVLPCRWVFVRKRDGTGSIVRFKARLVIKGFQQKHGIDYTEIIPPLHRKFENREIKPQKKTKMFYFFLENSKREANLHF
ncbi:Integrase, catalytic core protein [Phytophthora megakarya]|uniref:Integrase, catalytic core protein n=1 Tax=Phytophthora megakarya TaxID=4795 RepID=A0A225UTE4_9STRA|nr:Integrase, catalytic core protein [Phytophthora megakarya]